MPITRREAIIAGLGSTLVAGQTDSFPVKIKVDASQTLGELRPIWRFFGCDEPNYAYMPNGRELLGELGRLGKQQVYFRTHNLLTSGDGTPALKWGSTNAYTEDPSGSPVYDWRILDRIFDAYREHRIRPYVQMGFMPQALSVKPEPYQHHWTPEARYEQIYTGWAFPPRDYGRWAELIYQWAAHCVKRYGASEVERWYWETWNEPNIGYWQGSPEEFYRLHDESVAAVRRALPTARVGGPDTAGSGGRFMRGFLDHCLSRGTPLDFISFHAKGAPKFVNGQVRMGIANQLRTIDEGFALIASYPDLKGKPIVIGESDPDGCAACKGPQLGYRNSTLYASYTAASFARKHDLADRHGVNFEGALTWAFEFENQPIFAGFRQLASNRIDLPVLNVFRMFGKMSGKRVAVESSGAVSLDAILRDGVRGRPDVSALANVDHRKAAVLIWHYHDENVPGPDAAIELEIRGLRGHRARIDHYRIDEDHSNAYTVWKRMGSPENPTAAQHDELQAAGRLSILVGGVHAPITNGGFTLHYEKLPRQAVSLIVIET